MKNALICFAIALFAAGTQTSTAVAADDKKPETVEGYIHEADAKTHTFVLGGQKESRTTFTVSVQNVGNREAATILLDDKKTTFEEAVQAKRKAKVTFLRVGDELWVWKVAVQSK